jgi:hypothetical protein
MKRTFLVLALLLCPVAGHADFITTNTTLPPTKSDLHPLPSTADPTKYWAAADYNSLMNALLAVRTAIVQGTYQGLTAQASDPLPVYSTNYEWLGTNGKLHLTLIGPVDNLVVYGPVTTKGDLLPFNGTTFARLGVGADGTCLQAASAQATGLTWGACGGGSLGNYTASGNNLDISVAGTMAFGTGNTNATSMTFGNASATGPVLFNGGRLRFQQRAQSGAGLNALSIIGGGSTALTAATEYSAVNYQLNQTWEFAAGTVATERFYLIQAPTLTGASATATFTNAATLALSGPPVAGTNASITSPWALWLQTGNLGFGPNAAIGQSSQSATNTTGFTLNCNVADGASSIGCAFNNVTALTSGKLFSWQTAGVERMSLAYDGSTFTTLTGTAIAFKLVNNSGDGFQLGGSGTVNFLTGGAGMYTMDGTSFSSAGAPRQLGTSAGPFSYAYVQHPSGAGTAPTKAAGACLGGTQTVTLDANAHDAAGTITLTGTSTGTASATCATVTFNSTWVNAPHCQIAPVNPAASALSGAAALYVDSASTTTSVFVIKSGGTALVAGTYIYTYDCTQ